MEELLGKRLIGHERGGTALRPGRGTVREMVQAGLVGVLLAVSGAPALANEDPGQGQQYVVQPGDTVRVVIAGRQDLSGDYMVDLSGRVSVLPTAEVNAIGLTPRELGNHIGEALRQASGEPAAVSVQLASYRPVYLLGNVRSPGSYAFVPGMSALQAIAAAGGYFRGDETRSSLSTRATGEELASLLAQRFVLSVRRERLIAEKQGSMELNLSAPVLQTAAENALFDAVVEAERQLLRRRHEAFDLKNQGYERSRGLFNEEIEALEKQIEVQERLLSLVDQQLDAVKSIRDKGLVQQSIYLGLERDVSRSKSDLQSTQAFLSRARQNSKGADQSTLELRAQRDQGIEEELSANAQELIVMEGRIKSVEAALSGYPQLMTPADGVSSSPYYTLEILRSAPGANDVVITATQYTRLMPGDVLNVTQLARVEKECTQQ